MKRPIIHAALVLLIAIRIAHAQTVDHITVLAKVDLTAPGIPISPYIYGAAMGDRKQAAEMGLTILRAGGNEVTPLSWTTGFCSKGVDWYFENFGAQTAPEKNWLITFFRDNKAASLETYLTMPDMGRVAKDGTTAAYDTRKYPDQEDWAGKSKPDRINTAGNGVRIVKTPDGKQHKENIDADPDDTSVVMSPEDQTRMLQFMIKDMNYGTADKGGLKYIALDNEPALWNSTHRAMHPTGCSYDELWQRTLQYATRLKAIDPAVKIAGPTSWGWTEYFYSGLDSQLIEQKKGTWGDPPDYVAHGRVPLLKWWMKQLADHDKQTGKKLVDILDVHFYPQNGIYNTSAKTPAAMESRAQETRVLWDPTWKDPSWMGSESNHIIKLIPLMKQWIKECNPGMQLAIGEYNFGGEADISGGVAQAEILGIFAREQVDFAFYWFFPPKNSPTFFAYQMFRNPDGKHSAFGDKYLPSTNDHAEDVSVHAARDSASGRITFVLVNERSARSATVKIQLGRALPKQEMIAYQLSPRNPTAIEALPGQSIEGNEISIELPAMSVMRFDVKAGN